MSLKIQFLGGAGTVTGSKYLLTYKNRRTLIDCGLFQGLKTLRLKNWDRFPVDPSTIDEIILTHAHIDHSGYIPRLINKGFRGKIYATEATKDLCSILLPDTGYLMQEEAEYLNRKKRSKHKPALPLFTQEEAEHSIEFFSTKPFGEAVKLDEDLSFQFRYAGHILGASSAVISVGGRTIAFTGDVGRLNDRVLYPPAPLPSVDYLITESTYGDRLHEDVNVLDRLAEIINATFRRRGTVIIPAFAVGRSQSLMYDLASLRRDGRIPDVPIYLNSPMARNASSLMRKHVDLHRLSSEECDMMFKTVKYVHTPAESKALNERTDPMIIISASGMLTGGRVLHHIKAYAPHEKNTILLAGFQAAGTRGEALLNGVKEVKVHGDYIPVRAQIANLDNVSAHADYKEMMKWFLDSKISPKKVYITHGEPSAAQAFKVRLEEKFHWNCVVPNNEDEIEL